MTHIQTLNKVVEGWTEVPNGLMTNPNVGGGIIDRAIVSGEWFVVFDFGDTVETFDGYKSRDEAVSAFIDIGAKRTKQ